MQLIKNKAIVPDEWVFTADGEALAQGNVIVSLARFQHEKDTLFNHDGRIGARLQPSDDVTVLANELGKICCIELYFPDFADGRLFSHAWLLRERYHYTGDIRAVGNYLTDQLFYLSRVGVNAFAPSSNETIDVTLAKLDDFSVQYQ